MIVVITIIVIVLYRMDKRYKEDLKRMKELEEKLNEYYKESTNPEIAAELSQFILDNREVSTKETITRKIEKGN